MTYTKGDVITSNILRKIEEDKKLTEEIKKDLKAKGEAILKIFGSSGADKDDETALGPTRVSFADCYLDEDWVKMAKNNRWLLTEEKSENIINRIKGTAEHPRFIERVPEGTRFKFRVTFKVLQDGDEMLFNTVLLRGLKLLEMDALGGNVSRGYGRIAFEFDDKKFNEEFSVLDPFKEKTK